MPAWVASLRWLSPRSFLGYLTRSPSFLCSMPPFADAMLHSVDTPVNFTGYPRTPTEPGNGRPAGVDHPLRGLHLPFPEDAERHEATERGLSVRFRTVSSRKCTVEVVFGLLPNGF